LLGENIFELDGWTGALEPVRSALVHPLAAMFVEPTFSEADRSIAADLLAKLGRDAPDLLAQLAVQASPRAYAAFWPALLRHRARATDVMTASLAAPLPPRREEAERACKEKAIAALTLWRLGQGGAAWPLLRNGPDARIRSWLVHLALRHGVPEEALAARLEVEIDPAARQALLLALGEGRAEAGLSRPPERLADLVTALHANDPDPAVHAGAEWLLHAWGLSDRVRRACQSLRGKSRGGWAVNGEGLTMVVIPSPLTFRMGSPGSEPRRDDLEILHARRIDRAFALSAQEVTLEQLRRALPKHECDPQVAPTGDCPAVYVSWYHAVRFCRWLSEREGIAEDQMCFPPLDQIGPGMTLPPEGLKRTGYRLPTEAEWEAACRAGTETAFSFGNDEELLPDYAHTVGDSRVRVWPVGRLKPNTWGLFDMHGNAAEWCQDAFGPYPIEGGKAGDRLWALTPGAEPRALRGGGYRSVAKDVRAAKRARESPSQRFSFIGFRVARTVPQ
jgi:formylglycine-generating enzyme required for sulfatase activity